jgi:hypothetical protein
MRCTRTTSLAATRRFEQLKEAGARLATLNNDLIRRGNFKRVTVGAHFSRERVSESGKSRHFVGMQ